MSSESSESSLNATEVASEFTWKGAQTLKRVHALNERCLEVLAQLARAERQQINLPIVAHYQTIWRGMNVASRRRAAQTPFLLVDVHFQDTDWWRAARNASPNRRRNAAVLSTAFTGKIAGELMRETLMLAWNTVTVDRGAAGILLGMTPGVSGIIAELGTHEVERIAARNSEHLQPRWGDFPAFWGKLLVAASDADEDALHEIFLHGVQLIGSELLPLFHGRRE